MSEEKNNERDAAVEAFLKTVMASASVPSDAAAKTGEDVPAAAETAAEPEVETLVESVPEEESKAPELVLAPAKAPVPAAVGSVRPAFPKGPMGARKFGPANATQSVVKKPILASAAAPRSDAQKTQMAGMKSGVYPGKSAPARPPAPAPAPAPPAAPAPGPAVPVPETVVPVSAPVHQAGFGVKAPAKSESPVPVLNLIVNVVLLIMFMVLLVMLVTLKGNLARQDKAIGKLQESMDNVGTISKIKFGVVQDPKRGLLGVFIDGKDPTRYKVIDLKQEEK